MTTATDNAGPRILGGFGHVTPSALTRPCAFCGREIVYTPWYARAHGGAPVHCSDRCRGLAQRVARPVRVCEMCGKEYTRQKAPSSWSTQRFCSTRCANHARARANRQKGQG